MYRLYTSFHEIGVDLFYCDEKVLYKKDKNIYEVDDSIKKIFQSEGSFVIEKITRDFLLIRDMDSIYRINRNIFQTALVYSFGRKWNRQVKQIDADWLIFREEVDEKWRLRCASLINKKVIWELFDDKTFKVVGVEERFLRTLYSENKNLLFCHSLTTGQELWQADVSKMGQYLNISNVLTPGTVEELFTVGDVVVAKIDALALAAFSLHDGSVKWEYRFKMGYMYRVALYNGYFHVFADDYYRIEASTGSLAEQKPYREMFSAAKMKPYWYTGISVNDEYIAVSSHYDSAILLIDRATFTIAQRIDLEGCKSGIPLSNAPRLYGNRLFQLDGDGTLHIFEKE